MGKIISNGIQYSGLMNVEGVFIDTDNVIQTETTFTTSMSYTAIKDCCVYILFCGNNTSSGFIKIGNKEVGKLSRNDSTGMYVGQYFYVKKGQTISAETPNVQGLSYIVYGIQSGSNVISAENNYSTDEQVIGKWIDGSDIYQKTYDVTTPLTNNANNKIDANFDSSLYYPISVEATCVLSDGVNVLNAPYVNLNANPTQFVSVFVADGLYVGVKGLSINSASVTIKYIKLSS